MAVKMPTGWRYGAHITHKPVIYRVVNGSTVAPGPIANGWACQSRLFAGYAPSPQQAFMAWEEARLARFYPSGLAALRAKNHAILEVEE